MATRARTGSPWRFWPRLLLIIPLALVAWVPFYNRIEPTLLGVPFFYWYQLAAIIAGAVVVMGVYYLDRRQTVAAERRARAGGSTDEGDTDEGAGSGARP
ncbi:DUF3311 domain-containing protein [Methyloceanibacter methanicus]|uniref:DUF3311 domain-containing protein n=1 Tax=Methyloceanibacter methanicus TaxID=1774968 RepID=UPI000849B208|nr:DUF3311 domain-containing protein [Methyloceanibacter methanicus]